MKATITWRDAGCNSACGYCAQVIHTLSTFDKVEFDRYIQVLKENMGDALTFDFEPCATATKEEKSCENCGQPRDYTGQCILFKEGKCVDIHEKWKSATKEGAK